MREPRKRQQAAAAARNNVAPTARSTNLMDMPLDEFQGALAELAQQGVDTDALLRQYRAANSPVEGMSKAIFGTGFNSGAERAAAELAAAGRRPVAGGLLSKPAGATGMDALRNLKFNLGGGLLGMLAGAGQAADAPMAAYQGLIPQPDTAFEALGTASLATLGGGAVTRPAGSFGMGGRVVPDIDARVAAARQAVLDNPNDAALFDQYKALRRERDALGSRPADVPAERMPTADEGFEAYLNRVNPAGARIAEAERPNLNMGDMYGMLPRNARKMGERDGVSFYQGPDGATYATAFNPDVGEMDVVGFAMPAGDMTDLAVVNEMQGRGIGSELQYLMRSQDPYALSGGLTEAGERTLRGTYDRLRNEGIVAANASPEAGLLSAAAARTPAEQMARQILDMRAAGRAGDVTDEMMAAADPQYMFANTPLPMDEASRLARAADAGFNRNVYHGDMYSGTHPAFGRQNERAYFAYDPEDAGDYASYWTNQNPEEGRLFGEGAQIQNVMARAQNRAQDSDVEDAYESVSGMSRDHLDVSESWGPLNPDWSDYSHETASELRRRGFDSVFHDDDSTPLNGNYIDSIAILNPPTNIRSRFARFDPEFAHLSNLNAANIDPMAGLFGAMAAEEQRRRRNAP